MVALGRNKETRKAPTQLSSVTQSSKILVIGIGNAFRHDDAAGLGVARRLKEQAHSLCDVHEQIGEGTALMHLWNGADRVIVVDAVQSGAVPGTIHRFQANLHPLPAPIFRDSTHAFGLIEAIELSRALKQLPSNLVIYGIEGKNFEAGPGFSPAVFAAVDELAKQLQKEIVETT
jgi:hydrogenase maturation protease